MSGHAETIRRLGPWFHNLHLPDGTQTCPDHFLGDFPAFKWREIAPHVPEDLSGWTALDIGCNAGFYGFELARRGARVVGMDVDPHYLAQARWAAGVLGLEGQVTFERRDVYDLGRDARTFDLVLFMGVLYHLRYPLLGLDAVSRVVGRQMVFQTLTMPGEAAAVDTEDPPLAERARLTAPGWPRMAFLEHRLQGDPTNWWAPDAAAVEAMLRSTGMRVLAHPAHETWICEPDREGPSSFWTWDAHEFDAAMGPGGPGAGRAGAGDRGTGEGDRR